MKDIISIAVLCTVLQVSLSVFYFMLTKTVGFTLVVGFVLYAVAMANLYSVGRQLVRKKEKEDLLNALP